MTDSERKAEAQRARELSASVLAPDSFDREDDRIIKVALNIYADILENKEGLMVRVIALEIVAARDHERLRKIEDKLRELYDPAERARLRRNGLAAIRALRGEG